MPTDISKIIYMADTPFEVYLTMCTGTHPPESNHGDLRFVDNCFAFSIPGASPHELRCLGNWLTDAADALQDYAGDDDRDSVAEQEYGQNMRETHGQGES